MGFENGVTYNLAGTVNRKKIAALLSSSHQGTFRSWERADGELLSFTDSFIDEFP